MKDLTDISLDNTFGFTFKKYFDILAGVECYAAQVNATENFFLRTGTMSKKVGFFTDFLIIYEDGSISVESSTFFRDNFSLIKENDEDIDLNAE